MAKKKTKLKWSYDKTHKQWWICESVAWAKDGMNIMKTHSGNKYSLRMEHPNVRLHFKKLSTAKQVAQLIHEG